MLGIYGHAPISYEPLQEGHNRPPFFQRGSARHDPGLKKKQLATVLVGLTLFQIFERELGVKAEVPCLPGVSEDLRWTLQRK